MALTASFRAKVRLMNAATGEFMSEAEYATVPAIGTQIVVHSNETEIWAVEGVRHWPATEFHEPIVNLFVRFAGHFDKTAG